MPRRMTATTAEVVHYYDEMTAPYTVYGGDTLALHTGLCDAKTTSREDALLHSNDLLVKGLSLGPGRRILDAGCGLGGLAIYLAQKHRVEAVGITLCASHAEIATRSANRNGLEPLVQFHEMDYMSMDFPDNHFDAVLSQDAFCYAADLDRYFAGVARVLKPGGHWRAIDAFRATFSPSAEAMKLEDVICHGWKTPVFPHWMEVQQALQATGFGNLFAENLSPLAVPAAKDFVREKLLGDLAAELQSPAGRPMEVTFRNHMAACAAFGAGILDGSISYMRIGGTKN